MLRPTINGHFSASNQAMRPMRQGRVSYVLCPFLRKIPRSLSTAIGKLTRWQGGGCGERRYEIKRLYDCRSRLEVVRCVHGAQQTAKRMHRATPVTPDAGCGRLIPFHHDDIFFMFLVAIAGCRGRPAAGSCRLPIYRYLAS